MRENNKGKIHLFPKKSLLKGLITSEKAEKYADMRLYEDEFGAWWIRYSKDRHTGGFETKERAIQWFETKGR